MLRLNVDMIIAWIKLIINKQTVLYSFRTFHQLSDWLALSTLHWSDSWYQEYIWLYSRYSLISEGWVRIRHSLLIRCTSFCFNWTRRWCLRGLRLELRRGEHQPCSFLWIWRGFRFGGWGNWITPLCCWAWDSWRMQTHSFSIRIEHWTLSTLPSQSDDSVRQYRWWYPPWGSWPKRKRRYSKPTLGLYQCWLSHATTNTPASSFSPSSLMTSW
jgi:hypothetical protein